MAAPAAAPSDPAKAAPGWSVAALRLSDFRNYARLALDIGPAPVALAGANGAGKTNLLEAVSLLAPGRGLRGAAFADMVRAGAPGGWAVFARITGPDGASEIGTGYTGADEADGGRAGRELRINGEPARPLADLAGLCRMVWLTPAMDGLFSGPPGERRRFLDRLVQAVDPGHRRRASAFETAMRQRNALLDTARPDPALAAALEAQMAEHAIAVAAARLDCVRLLQAGLAERCGESAFPQAALALDGAIETDLAAMPATDAEDRYRQRLAAGRAADAAARRTLAGPHRSDLVAWHAVKRREAALCSTGEQKMLLIGLVLAHARLVGRLAGGHAPMVLLDEIAAHLDARHRAALFAELGELGTQAWMSGTDPALFDEAPAGTQLFAVEEARLTRLR